MATTDARVADLLGQMTLEEKIALTIGRDFWTTNSVERLGITPVSMNDGPHGIRKPANSNDIGIGGSIPATCFPTASALAASWDTALAEEIGVALGEECLAQDVQVLLGPGVNMKRTPLGGRNFEYFSEDPVLAGEMGAALVKGIQSKGVGTSLKHYACNNQEWDRMTINAEIDERTLREIYLPAFERVVKKAQPWTVMAAYNKVNGVYASENPHLLTEILKGEWGFTGLVVSDWGAVNVKAQALIAGLDLEMPGPVANHTEKIAGLVREGVLPEAAVDAAAANVLALILHGTANRKQGATFDQAAHHALARRAAAESIVLLKNSDDLLPLDRAKVVSVAVIGRFADTPRYQGSGSSQVVPTRVDSPLAELKSWLGDAAKVTYAEGYGDSEQPDDALIKEAVAQAQAASLAIIFAGLPDSFESEGYDRTHISMPESHNKLIEEVSRVQPQTIVVLHNGSVVAMPWLDDPKAVLEAGLGGQAMGGAIVDVLSGAVNPSGRLAETYPARLEDTPAFINYPGEGGVVIYGERNFIGYRYYDKKKIIPLFPFGYGLSYTTFAYSGFMAEKATIQAGETLSVTVKVRNTGDRTGKEVVQLYVRPLASAYSRPVRELKAFTKVALNPGETKEVRLTLADRDFMVYDTARHGWRMEGGEYELEIGGPGALEPLQVTITVKEDPKSARPVFERMSTIKILMQDPVGREVISGLFKGSPAEEFVGSMNEMFLAMPLIKLATFGNIPEEAIDALVAKINETPIA